MRNLLNTAWHILAKKLEKEVGVSGEELKIISERTDAISRELKEWVGEGEHELISLGQNCNSSWYIKDTGQKKASYPFDWIASSPEMVIHLISDDFRHFLDLDLIISKGIRAGHKIYHADLFGHRNPKRSVSDMAYFQRCVQRWQEMMWSQRPVIFIITVLNEHEKRPLFSNGFTADIPHPGIQKPADFDEMVSLLLVKNPNARFLFLEQYTEQDFQLEIIQCTEKRCWIRHQALGANSGVKFLNHIDDQVMRSVYTAIGNGRS